MVVLFIPIFIFLPLPALQVFILTLLIIAEH